ncbi:Melanopsin [Holothuria leucospilota]|uniref:Melanopsin n=1 Tax=Holothuria leucospilota TaxID=206669 RepID=A0A9Q1C170_HOLLE|nr:Melanopsin [Holothuria leucospilota]
MEGVLTSFFPSAYDYGNSSAVDIFYGCDLIDKKSASVRNTYVAVYCLMLLICVVTNTTILYIIIRKRLWRDVSVIMIANLAVNDVLVCVSVLVPEISEWMGYFEDSVYKFATTCRVHAIAEALFPTVTIFSLVVMSYERFRISRAKILTRSQPNRRFVAIATLLGVWLLALASALPAVKMCIIYSPTFTYLEIWSPFMVNFTIARFVLIYMTPLFLIAVFYTFMAVSLFGSLTSHKSLKNTLRSSSAGRRAQRGRRRLAAMVITLVVAFAVGWMPHYIFRFMGFYGHGQIFCTGIVQNHLKNFHQIFFCLVSLLNPFIVFVIGANFRRYLLDMIPCSPMTTFRRKGKAAQTTSVTWASRSNQTPPDETEGIPLNSIETPLPNGER